MISDHQEKVQAGGSHYLSMGIQPREMAMANGWDADAFSCLKYLSRYEQKVPLLDLQKARHFAELRRDFGPPALMIPPRVRLRDYLEQNGFASNKPLVLALHALWDTVYVYDGVRLYSEHLTTKIDDLICSLDLKN